MKRVRLSETVNDRHTLKGFAYAAAKILSYTTRFVLAVLECAQHILRASVFADEPARR